MMSVYSLLPPKMFDKHVTLLKMANSTFSHPKAVRSHELEYLLDEEDDPLSGMEYNLTIMKPNVELNIFEECIYKATSDELGLDKTWMPPDLLHSREFQMHIIHDNYLASLTTEVSSGVLDLENSYQSYIANQARQRQRQRIGGNDSENGDSKIGLSLGLLGMAASSHHYGHSQSAAHAGHRSSRDTSRLSKEFEGGVDVATMLLGIESIGAIYPAMQLTGIKDAAKSSLGMISEFKSMDASTLKLIRHKDNDNDNEVDEKQSSSGRSQISMDICEYSIKRSLRVIPRLTLDFLDKENCDANLRLFCRLFPHQSETHKEQLVKHFVGVAKVWYLFLCYIFYSILFAIFFVLFLFSDSVFSKDAKTAEKSENIRVVLQNSAAVMLGSCQQMMQCKFHFGKGKVRDLIVRIASDFLSFSSSLVMRAGAQMFGILAKIEDKSFKQHIIQYLSKKKFNDPKVDTRAAAALALGCIHKYSGSKENVGYTIATLQMFKREGRVSLWLLHALSKILKVITNQNISTSLHAAAASDDDNSVTNDPNQNNNQATTDGQQTGGNNGEGKNDDATSLCRNVVSFCLLILADQSGVADVRIYGQLLKILNILLSYIVQNIKQSKGNSGSHKRSQRSKHHNLLQYIILILKFMERCRIPSLYGKILDCIGLLCICAPEALSHVSNGNNGGSGSESKSRKGIGNSIDVRDFTIHEIQYCLFNGNTSDMISAIDCCHHLVLRFPSVLTEQKILNCLLYLFDTRLTDPIIGEKIVLTLKNILFLNFSVDYPQTLLKYFKRIALRGMVQKAPEMEQMLTLMPDTKNLNNQTWLLIPPSLNGIRYSTEMFILLCIEQMIGHSVMLSKKEGKELNASLARKYIEQAKKRKEGESSNNNNNNNNNINKKKSKQNFGGIGLNNNDIIYEDGVPQFMILAFEDVVKLVCKGCDARTWAVRYKGLELLPMLIKHFGNMADSDAGISGVCMLDQYQAQIDSALRSCISVESEPSVRCMSVNSVIEYLKSRLPSEATFERHIESLFEIFERGKSRSFDEMCGIYESHVRTVILLEYLKGAGMLYNYVYYGKSDDLQQLQKQMKRVFNNYLIMFKNYCEMGLYDYVIITSTGRRELRDFEGHFFNGVSYKRVFAAYLNCYETYLNNSSLLYFVLFSVFVNCFIVVVFVFCFVCVLIDL